MSAFYGQVKGMANTTASRRGGKNIVVSAQSWNGSVITELYYNDENQLMVRIELSEDSSMYGNTYFEGTFEDLKKLLGGKLKCQ